MELRDILTNEVSVWEKLENPAFLHRFVLRNGQDYRGVTKPKHMKMMTKKECYANATQTAFSSPHIQYCEGYAMHKEIKWPFLHAWNLIDGRVVDLTLEEPKNYEYVGVTFDRPIIEREIASRGIYGLLGSDFINVALMVELDPTLADEVSAVLPKVRQMLEKYNRV